MDVRPGFEECWTPMRPGEIRHFRGDSKCPVCGGRWDPGSGYCPTCEGEMRLWRVTAMTDEWLSNPNAPASPTFVVSEAHRWEQAEALCGPDTTLILMQLERK